MELITIQGTGLASVPSRGVEEDRNQAIAATRRDAILKVSFSPELMGDLRIRNAEGTREFAEDSEKIILAADNFIVDTVSSQESTMPSGRFKAVYTYVIDAPALRLFLLSQDILVRQVPDSDTATGAATGQSEQAERGESNEPPDPVDLTVSSPTHQIVLRGEVRTRSTLKSKIAGKLPLGTLVRVRREFIGAGCEWHEIVVADDSPLIDPAIMEKFGPSRKYGIYIHRSQAQKLEATPDSLEIACACRINKNYTPPDWRNMPEQSPFLDKSRCEYSVVVTTRHTDTGGIELNERKANAIPAGIMKLLKFYDKNIVIEDGVNRTLDRLMKAFRFAYVEDGACGWHLDARPGSKLKILVRVPAKYFDALPRSLDNLQDVAKVEVIEPTVRIPDSDVPDSDLEEEEEYKDVPPISQEGYRVAHYVVKRLKAKIKLIGEMFNSTNSMIQGFRGTVSVGGLPIDLKKEYKLLEQCPTSIVRLLSQNGFKVSELDDTVEIGFNKDFRVEYVLSNKGAASVPCKIGFDDWRNQSPIDNPTTMALLFYLDDLIPLAQLPDIDIPPWSETIGNFIFPVPDVKLSAGFPKVGVPNFSLPDIGSAGSLDLPSFDLNTDFNLDLPNKVSGLQFKFDGASLKSLGDLDIEDASIKLPDLKLKLADIRMGELDFIGDNLFANAKDLIPKIGSLDDIFGEFLNKVSLPDIAKLLAGVSAPELPFGDLMGSISTSAMKFGELSDLKSILSDLPPIPKMKINAVLGSFETGVDFQTAWDMNLLDDLGRLELRRAGEISLKISELGLGQFPKCSEIDFSLDDYTRAVGDAADAIDLSSLEASMPNAGILKDINLSPSLMKLSPDDLSFTKVESLLTGGKVLDLRGKLSLDGVDLDLDDISQFVDIQSSPNMMKGMTLTAEGILNRCGKDLTAEADVLRDAMLAFCDGPTLAAAVEKRLPEAFAKVKGLLDGRTTKAISQVTSVMDSIPTLSLPSDFPIFDSEPTDAEIVDAVKEAVTTALESMVKDMLGQISDFAMGLLPGSEEVLPAGSVDMGSSMRNKSADSLATKLKTEGIDPSVLVPPPIANPANEEDEDFEIEESSAVTGGDAVKRFLQDISTFLRPDEVCSLFEGKPSQSTARMIKGLVKERYPSLHDHFSSTSSVTSFFAYLGGFVDPGICRGVKEKMMQIDPPLISGLPCATNGTGRINSSSRSSLFDLRERLLDGRASTDQIGDLLGKIKDHKKKRLTELLDIAAGQPILADVTPPVMSDCEEESNIQPNELGTEYNTMTAGLQGIIKRTTPSTETMMDQTVKSMTSGVDLAFSNDCEATLNALIQDDDPRLINQFDNEFRDVKALLKAEKDVESENGALPSGGVANAYMEAVDTGTISDDRELAKFLSKNSASVYKKDKTVLPKVQAAMRNPRTVAPIAKALADPIPYEGISFSVPSVSPARSMFGEDNIRDLERLKNHREELRKGNIELSRLTGEDARTTKVEELNAIQGRIKEIEDTFKDNDELKNSTEALSMGNEPMIFRTRPSELGKETISVEYMHGASRKRKTFVSPVPLTPTAVEFMENAVMFEDRDNRAQYFANVLWKGYTDSLTEDEKTVYHNQHEHFEEYFKFLSDAVYLRFTVRILRVLLERVSESNFFTPSLVSQLELNKGEFGYESGDPCKTTPPEGLLRVKHLKDKIKKDYRDSCGSLNPNTTGPLQRAMSGGIVDLVVRVGVVDNYIKGLQAMQVIDLEDTGLIVLRDFIANKITTDIKYGYNSKNFHIDFFNDINESFINKVTNGPVLKDPLFPDKLLYEENQKEAYANHPDTLDGTNALKYKVSEVLLLLRASLEEQFQEVGLHVMSNIFNEVFVSGTGVTIDVPDYHNQARFFKSPNRLEPGADPDQEFQMQPLSSRDEGIKSEISYDQKNGGYFTFERYFRVIPKIPREVNQPEQELVSIIEGLFQEFNVTEFTAPAHQIPNLTRDERLQWECDGESGQDPRECPFYGPYNTERGVVLSVSRFNKFLESLRDATLDTVRNGDVRSSPMNRFLEVYSGVRYTYIATDDERRLAGSGFFNEGTFAPRGGLLGRQVAGLSPGFQQAQPRNSIASREKALFLREKETRMVQGLGGPDTRIFDTPEVGVISIPIAFEEEELPMPTISILGSGGEIINDTVEVGTQRFDRQRIELVSSPTIQSLREIFPLKAYASIVAAYNTQAAELSVFELGGSFASTKEELRSAFYSLRSSGDDLVTEEDEKIKAMGGQAGLLKSLKGGSSPRPSADFPALWGMAAMTVPTLLKGVAAELDPHYSLVNKIDAALELAGAGGFPTGTTWLSVPIFWPVNFSPLPLFVGWGPPLTPLGMIAYSLADFDLGEKKRARKRKAIKNAGKKCDGA